MATRGPGPFAEKHPPAALQRLLVTNKTPPCVSLRGLDLDGRIRGAGSTSESFIKLVRALDAHLRESGWAPPASAAVRLSLAAARCPVTVALQAV